MKESKEFKRLTGSEEISFPKNYPEEYNWSSRGIIVKYRLINPYPEKPNWLSRNPFKYF